MEKVRNNPSWGVMVFVMVFVASILMLLADNAVTR
jgi:cbb3-type cytochrome oxidase subunit 3